MARAHCVPTSSIPDAQEGNLSEQECATAQPSSYLRLPTIDTSLSARLINPSI
jgi:hypothetical protein